MKCSKCGFENNQDNKFCANCGNNLNEVVEEKVQEVIQEPIQENNTTQVVNEPVQENVTSDAEIVKEKKESIFKRLGKTKLLIIGGILLALIVALVLFFVFHKSDEEKALRKMFDMNTPILIEENNKYGYIDTKGKVLIKPQYDVAGNFKGDYTYVSKKTEDGLLQKVEFIDKKGKVKLSFESKFDAPVYLDMYGVWYFNNSIYNENLELVFSSANLEYIGQGYFYYNLLDSKKSGIINYEKEEILTRNTDSLEVSLSYNAYSDKDLYFLLETDDKYEIYSLKAKKIISSYSSDDYSVRVYNNNIFKVSDDLKTKYLYLKNAKVLYQTDEEFECVDYEKDILELNDDSYYDAKNKKQLYHVEFYQEDESSAYFYNKFGYKAFKETNYGFKNKKGKVIVKPEYESFGLLDYEVFKYLSNEKGRDYIVGVKNNTIDLIDLKSGKVIEKFDGAVNADKKGIFLVIYYGDSNGSKKSFIVYNLITNKKSDEYKYGLDIDFGLNYYLISDEENLTYKYYNSDFKNIYTYVDNTRANLPDLKYKTIEEAEKVLKEKGISYTIEEKYDAYRDAGKVIQTSPSSGIIDKTKEVIVTVSLGKTTIVLDNYVGQNYETVKAMLEQKGIYVSTSSRYFYPEGTVEGTILEQSKLPGETLKTGDYITLYYAY